MTTEELAAEFVKFATETTRDTPYEKGRSCAYMTAAFLVRKHLCTPLDAAAIAKAKGTPDA